MNDCKFCNIRNPILENEYWIGIYDKFPVTDGHILLIPKRHSSNYFECLESEKQSLLELIDLTKEFLIENYHPNGFNVGFNVGEVGGQTIFHTHIHIIPRYNGDMENPKGGVRGVIPSKQSYNG